MNIMQVAVLLIRLTSLSWFIEAGLILTYLPNDIFGVRNLQSGYLITQREIDIVMKLVRFLIYGVLGMVFNIYAIPVARMFTQGLEGLESRATTEEVRSPSESWPPPPRSVSEPIVTKPGDPAV